MKVSDRDRNFNNVRIIVGVLMNFKYEMFNNQMNLFIDIQSSSWCMRQKVKLITVALNHEF